jgi:hypothetical protein
MQPNEITLAVDEANDETTVDHVYTRFEDYLNRSVYICADHELSSKNTLTLYRTFPKINGNFKGVSKSTVKFSTDYLVDGVDGVSQLTAPVIVEIGFSLPVGITSAQALLARQKVIAMLDDDDIMAALNDQLMV